MGSGMTDANAMERIMQLKRIQRRTGTLAVLSLLFGSVACDTNVVNVGMQARYPFLPWAMMTWPGGTGHKGLFRAV